VRVASKGQGAKSEGTIIKEMNEMHGDLLHLFQEVGKIQRELGVDFVAPKKLPKNDNVARLRESWSQTECGQQQHCGVQVIESELAKEQKTSRQKHKEHKNKMAEIVSNVPVPKMNRDLATKKVLLPDEEAMKKKMREQLMRPQYCVDNFYHQTGCAQAIARSVLFENLTFLVICLNALWLAVDTDNNDAVMLNDAHPVFQVAENLFCSYFTVEIMIRFLAFREKTSCLHDFWFCFDGLLVSAMILETWLLTLVVVIFSLEDIGGNLNHFTILRIARLVKLFRMARMARLLRMVPELVVILKGIGVAFRSVVFFFILTVIIVYVWAVFFRQVTKDSEIESRYFSSVPDAMNSLVVYGMLPVHSRIINDLAGESPILWSAIMFFILLAYVTVLNMLNGVLVEVVRSVAATEKEGLTVTHVKLELQKVLDAFRNETDIIKDVVGELPFKQDTSRLRKSIAPAVGALASIKNSLLADANRQKSFRVEPGNLSRLDYEHFLMTPEVSKIIQEVGVDVIGLIDIADMVYEDKDKEGHGLSFVDFIDVVLNMRGTNPSTVKDVKDQDRVLKNYMKETTAFLLKKVGDELDAIRLELMEQLIELRKAQLRQADSSSDSDEDESDIASKLKARASLLKHSNALLMESKSKLGSRQSTAASFGTSSRVIDMGAIPSIPHAAEDTPMSNASALSRMSSGMSGSECDLE
jgi:hypothetical protein